MKARMAVMKQMVLLCLALMGIFAAHATTWYVAANGGSDSNDGKSEKTAFLTIQKAVDIAEANDTVCVAEGTYATFRPVNYSVPSPSQYRKKLAIKAINGVDATIIQGGVLQLGDPYGFDASTAMSVEGFTIKGCSKIDGGLICRCRIVSNSGSSYIVGSSRVYNSVFYKNSIQSGYGEFYYTYLYNCTIYENHGKYVAYDSMGTTFYNCIIFGNNKGRYVCTNWGSYAYNSYEADPKCINADSGDFRLSSESPCINVGNNSYVNGNRDFAGNARIYNGTVDIGAYEWQPASAEVKNVTAMPRYPWSGDVDVSFTITGEAGTTYATSFVAKDLVGGTNLTMKTVTVGGVVSPISLGPGAYHAIWNAAADLPNGFSAERVSIEVMASKSTGASPEFRLDLRGLGPWQRHTAQGSESLAYSSSWATNAAAGAKAVVKVMPVLKTKPKYLVIDLSGGTSATHYPISYLDEVPGGSWSDEYKTSKLVLRHIPAGSFIMGGRATDYPGAVNTNLHMVTITRDFYMGVFEVTQRQWELVMGTRPSAFNGDALYADRPVESISWTDVRGGTEGVLWPKSYSRDDDSFLGKIRLKTSCSAWDLPTDEQWEYACRAGTTTYLYDGSNYVAHRDFILGQYSYNSGWSKLSSTARSSVVACLVNGKSVSECWPDAMVVKNLGVATAGSYPPNDWGLYDMYGNVYEMCLDSVSDTVGVEGKIAPAASNDILRVVRGGSFVHGVDRCNSVRKASVGQTRNRVFNLGFRLCLQGGDVPDLAAATTLVNEAGAGSQSWTPTRSGTYYLTHSTMNGEANAQLMSAWFEVPGCKLTLEPQGELTNGVSVAITGAGEGWTVYYTTNGLAPSKASEKYTGPFSLPESATVRAVAYNAQGVASEEATTSFTLHDALSVVGAVARPRYPWNGMVDVDCEIKGDPAAKYEVEVVVKDLEGGTNIEVRTVGADHRAARNPNTTDDALGGDCGAPRTSPPTIVLPPGAYRLTWNADADIAYDHDFPRVAVTVKAMGREVESILAYDAATVTSGVSIVWSAMAAAQTYRVYRKSDFGTDTLLGNVAMTHYEDNSITNSGIYSYYVKPVLSNGVEGNASAIVSAKCYRVAVPEGAIFYLPMDGDAKNYGTVAHSMTMWGDKADWFWLEDRYGDEQGAYYCTTLDHYMLLPDCDSFAVTNSFSVSFWAKSERRLVTIAEERAEGMYGVEGLDYPYVLYSTRWPSEDESLAGFCVAVGTNGVVVSELSSWWFPAPLVYSHNIGSGWNHFVVTINNNAAPILYVNGEFARMGLKTEKLKKISASAIGGDFNHGMFGKYKGYVDDFLIYDRALTADEVRIIFNRPNRKIGRAQ